MGGMRIATCPPDYFPTAAWFARFMDYDRVVLDTTAQFSRQSGHNRTRLRNPTGWQWISVPVEHGRFTAPIRDIRIAGDPGWRTRHRKALKYNYESAPFYAYYADALHDYWETDWSVLGEASTRSVILLAQLMQLPVPFESVAAGEREPVGVDADTHVREPEPQPYRQNFNGWMPGMSAIDLLMNAGPRSVDVLQSMVANRDV